MVGDSAMAIAQTVIAVLPAEAAQFLTLPKLHCDCLPICQWFQVGESHSPLQAKQQQQMPYGSALQGQPWRETDGFILALGI